VVPPNEQQNTPQYSFMAWNTDVLPIYPDGKGDEFPAFLTWRSGVDMVLIDLMRPLSDKGLRPEVMADTLLELHSKKYHSQYLKQERTLLATGDLCESGMFSEFSDRTKYDGLVPTGIYLSHCYKNYHATIQDHFLDKEVKKRGAVP
jgi:hypothetical protein